MGEKPKRRFKPLPIREEYDYTIVLRYGGYCCCAIMLISLLIAGGYCLLSNSKVEEKGPKGNSKQSKTKVKEDNGVSSETHAPSEEDNTLKTVGVVSGIAGAGVAALAT